MSLLSRLSRPLQILIVLGLTLVGFLLLSIPFWIWPVDLAVQAKAFDAEGGGWYLSKTEPWNLLYKVGTLPALIFVLATIAIFVLSFRYREVLPARKLAAYFVLCMLIGPGLLINAVFKEHWGRPRPRDVEPFGGQYAHERVWQYDETSPGKSFPCGHCSMGFYFFSLALVFAAAGRRRSALYVLGGALVLGGFLGVARIVQGGHFLSDVLWSAGMCLFASVGLFYALALDRSLAYRPRQSRDGLAIPLWVKLAGAGLALVGILSIGLATPYEREESYPLELAENQELELSLILEGVSHVIVLSEDEEPAIYTKGQGFGLPGSAIKSQWKDEPGEGEHYFQYKQRRSGFFTELKQTSRIVIPSNRKGYFKVEILSGNLTLDLSSLTAKQKWVVSVESPGSLEVRRPPEGEDLLILETD